MIKFGHKGDFTKLSTFLEKCKKGVKVSSLDRFGQEGVKALMSATPIDTGLTSASWYYDIVQENGITKINFNNSNIQNGCAIAVILQYGHGTRTGGWVEGRDYINPAIQPVFDNIANEAWKEVGKL